MLCTQAIIEPSHAENSKICRELIYSAVTNERLCARYVVRDHLNDVSRSAVRSLLVLRTHNGRPESGGQKK